MNEPLEEAIWSQIAQAPDLGALWDSLAGFAEEKGFHAIAYYLLHTQSHLPTIMPLTRGFPDNLREAYAAFDLERLDVVPRATLAAGRPVSWLQVWRTATLTPAERELFDALMANGMDEGYSLPCYGPNGRHAVVSIGMMTAATDRSRAALDLIHYVAQAVHLRICAFFTRQPAMEARLSNREKEILDWVARGKSNGVIAEILGIAPGTVDTYVRRIYEKLDVSDRTSAAVKGVGLGLIAA